jgi:cytochrome c oxidase subunit 1
MSTHGAMMITVALISIIGGLGNYLVPIMIGARDMAFPKTNALSYWLLPLPLLLVAINPLLGGFDTGWTAYPPLSQQANLGQQAYLMAFVTIGISSILSAINFLVTVFRMRAPGMSLMRMPIFVWALTVTATLALVATSVVAGAFTMLLFDRVLGTSFFRPGGRDVVLFQHLFWFYSHPAVYVMAVPAFGAILEVVPVFARKPLFAYRLAVLSFIGIGLLSFMVWAHHMFVSGMAEFFHIPIMVTTELISVPTGIVFLSALGTIWMGGSTSECRCRESSASSGPAVDGITGVYLADVPTDIVLSDTYFVRPLPTRSSGPRSTACSRGPTTGSRRSPAGCTASAWARSTSGGSRSPSTSPSCRCSGWGSRTCGAGLRTTQPSWARSTCS